MIATEHINRKKPKGKELSVEERWLNGIFAGARVVVENTIAGVKRCRIVKDVLRNTKEGFSDIAMEVACALHNFCMECRHSLSVLYSNWPPNAIADNVYFGDDTMKIGSKMASVSHFGQGGQEFQL